MNKFEEILKAWVIKWKPSQSERELALKRLKICSTCSYRRQIIEDVDFSVICGECGCPLEAKIHSPKKGACGIGKWDVVDGL